MGQEKIWHKFVVRFVSLGIDVRLIEENIRMLAHKLKVSDHSGLTPLVSRKQKTIRELPLRKSKTTTVVLSGRLIQSN